MERCTASFVLATSLNIFHLLEQYEVTNWLEKSTLPEEASTNQLMYKMLVKYARLIKII